MYKIAVIGDNESIFLFSALGITAFEVSKKEEAAALLEKLSQEAYGIIYITRKLAVLIPEEIKKYSFTAIPSITVIP